MTNKTLAAYERHEKHDAADFEHAHFAMHPVTGSVASKGRMDWKWVLPGWYDTGDVGRLSDQQMAEAGWSPVRTCPNPERHATGRPLTPDAITDEMIERASQAYFACTAGHYEDFRRAIVAALTEPPARPDWQGLSDVLRDIDHVVALSLDELAEAAYERGVRVVTEEQS